MKSLRLLCLIASLGVSGWAHAGIDIKLDIDGGTQQMQDNVRAFLSLDRYTERNDLQAETLERLSGRIPLEAAKALEPLGYYEPEVTYQLRQTNVEKNNWEVRIAIKPGRAVRLSEVNVTIEGEGKDNERIADELSKNSLRPGQRLDHGAYDTFKNNLLRAATSSGYLEAHWVTSDLLIDKAERRAYVTLQLETGARYYFGEISIDQNVIDPDKMQRLLRMKQGDPYDLDLLLQTQYVLDDTQYFAPAEVESGTADPETHTVPIKVTGKPNRKNSYGIAVGYGTDTQARGTLTWDRRLVNSAGHRAKLELTGSAIGHEESLRYVIPVRDVALEKLEFTLSDIKEVKTDNTTSYRKEFTPSFTQVLGSWQRVLFTKLSLEHSVYETTVTDDTVVPPVPINKREDIKTFLIIPGISYATLPTYILGQQQRRYTLYAELTGSPSSLGSGASFVQARVQAERVFDLSEKYHLRLRGEVGASWLSDKNFSELPVSVRFFAGGDNSVRGFSLNELSPVDADGNKVGARNLLVGTTEIERDLPKNFRLAVFYDIGNAIDHFSDDLEYSAGIGLRYHISVASLGLDVAQALSEKGRTPRLHLHISTLF
ncbi:MAG: BamA/TamA family outer membrane protein [Steroidobacteraceae bacterium]